MFGKAIYLDDGMSGAIVHGNIIEDTVGAAINVGGGRFNTITNNLMINCGTGIYFDDRYAEGGWASFLESLKDGDPIPHIVQMNKEVTFNKEIWEVKYPNLFKIKSAFADSNDIDWAGNPSYAVIKNNITAGCHSDYEIVDAVKQYAEKMTDIMFNHKFAYRDAILEKGTYKLLEKKVSSIRDWEDLPKEKMGRYSETNPRE